MSFFDQFRHRRSPTAAPAARHTTRARPRPEAGDPAPAPGDKALFYGRVLTISEIIENGRGVQLAVLTEPDETARRNKAIGQIRELRARQAALTGPEHEELAARIRKLNETARMATFRVRLRCDLLSFWAERGVWVSDGRILSDDQRDAIRQLTGRKVRPDSERLALALLEGGA